MTQLELDNRLSAINKELNAQKQYEKKLEEYQQERDTRRKLNE